MYLFTVYKIWVLYREIGERTMAHHQNATRVPLMSTFDMKYAIAAIIWVIFLNSN